MTQREQFEAWAAKPPREWNVVRNPDDVRKSAWPGQYQGYHVECAWQAFQAARYITPAMIDAGAQRLVSWEDDCTWPDSWRAIDVAAARNSAERVLRSALYGQG